MSDTKTLNELCSPLIYQLNLFCQEQGLIGLVQADRVSMKCSSSDIYEARRKEMEDKSTFIFQSMIAGRRAALIGLKEMIKTTVGDIAYLEVSDQKPDNSQIDRIDHVGLVPITVSYEELLEKLRTQHIDVKEVVRPHQTTHDITLPTGFIIRLSKEFLVDKIKREEML